MIAKHPGLRWAIVFVLGGALLVMFLVRFAQTAAVTAQIRDTQVTNTQTLNYSHAALNAIKDCTQPSGQCYQRSQKATGDAVSNINRVIILAAACASGLHPGMTVDQRQSAIQQCVIERLAAHSR